MRKIKCISLFVLLIWSCILNAQFTKMFEFQPDNPGTSPVGEPVSDGTYLYGMTQNGGTNNVGLIYKVKLNGTDYSVLTNFDGINKGRYPSSSLILSGTILYGMTTDGGVNDMGCIFKINTDGTGFTKLIDFDGLSKGKSPRGSLLLSGSTLYGTTYWGGTTDNGVVFKVNTDGTSYTKLIDFDGATKGKYPEGGLVISGSTLYGTTYMGGLNSKGVLFKVNTNGTGFKNLLNFNGTAIGSYPVGSLVISGTTLFGMTWAGGANTNGVIYKFQTVDSTSTKLIDFDGTNKGSNPKGSLLLSGSVLYGMASGGGTNGGGVVFKLDTINGLSFAKLLDISAGSYCMGSLILNSTQLYGISANAGTFYSGYLFKINTDGSGYASVVDFNKPTNGGFPTGSLIQSGSALYGMTSMGGLNDMGVLFKINTNGTGFTKILDFDGTNYGSNPYGSLLQSGTKFYGMTRNGGANNKGIIFSINTDGTGFTKLLDFDGTNGQEPMGSLIISGTTLYGMTSNGGSSSNGVVFKINNNGTGYSTLVNFDGANNGRNPYGDLTISGTTLYGLTSYGGANDKGVLFKVNTDGTGFSRMVDFDGVNKGNTPMGSLILYNNILYGTTSYGGINGKGVVFKIKSNGSDFQKIYEFTAAAQSRCALTLSGSMLYGTTMGFMMMDKDILFSVSIDGTGFKQLIDFDGITYGSEPQYCKLLKISDKLYGMTGSGGAYGKGVLYSIVMPPVQATNIDTTFVGSRKIGIKWKNGNGDKRVVFMKQSTSGTPIPVDGNAYTANDFGKGTQIGGTGWYCVYNGKDTMTTINGLTPNRSYMIKVCEFIGDTLDLKYYKIDSTQNPHMVTTIKESQIISFPALTDKTYGTADYSPGATSDKGLTITYTSSDNNVISIIDGKIHIENNGTCTIYANQPGDDTTFAAIQKTQTIKIQKATLTIKADNKSRDYYTKANTKFTITYSGFVNGEDSLVLTTLPVATCVNSDTSKPGAYPIVPSGATATNYTIIYQNGTLTINPSLIQLCIVRYDVSEKRNMIVWERVKGMNIKSYKILKEKSTNVYDTLGTVPYNSSFTYFIDTVTNPDIQAIKYKICAVDSSDIRSLSSSYHRSINLSKIPGSVANQLVLIWNEYDDESKVFVPSNYHIYRDNGTGSFSLYVDQPAGLPSYNVNVNNVVPGEQFQIVVDKTIPCNPALPFKAEAGPYSQSLSNIVEFKTSDLQDGTELPVSIFPNPIIDAFTIQLKLAYDGDVRIEIVNELGTTEYSCMKTGLISGLQSIHISTVESNLSAGIHFIKVTADNKISITKMICIK